MASKYLKKHTIPEGFQEILTEFTKEILRNQPIDIVDFSCEYFRCLQEGLLLDYAGRGENLPCDFKPSVPKIPERKNKIEISKEDEMRYKKSLEKSKEVGEEVKEEDEEEQKKEEEPKIEEEKKEEIKSEEPKKEEEVVKEEKKSRVESALSKEEKQLHEDLKDEEKDKPGELQIDTDSKNETTKNIKFQNTLQTEENKKMMDTAPALTLPEEEENIYQNCIDFPEKEAKLEELKATYPDEVNKYQTEVFTADKELNDLLIEMQNSIQTYYTSNEENVLTESINAKIEALKQNTKLQIMESNLLSLPLKDAVNGFKRFDYYSRMVMGYYTRMKNIFEDNNIYVDEFCYFLFNQKLKKILEGNAKEILEKFPYVKQYFVHNIELLQPEIFSLTLNCKKMTEDVFLKLYTSFSVRKRELCQNFFTFYYMDGPRKDYVREKNLLEKCLYISSLEQIYEKLQKISEDNKDNELQTVTDKIQTNYNTVWVFIGRIINTPIELISTSYYQFEQCDSLERAIILRYLSLQVDYVEIAENLSKIQIDSAQSDFVHKMKLILSIIEHNNGSKDRYVSMFNRKAFAIPSEISDFVKGFEGEVNEEEKMKTFRAMNSFLKDGIYYYLTIDNLIKENEKMKNILEKMKGEKDLREAADFCKRVENLKENFTIDSNEFIDFIEQFNEWKKGIHQGLKDFFALEDDKKTEEFKKLSNDEKVSVLNIIYVECDIDENSALRAFKGSLSKLVAVEGNEFNMEEMTGSVLYKIIKGEITVEDKKEDVEVEGNNNEIKEEEHNEENANVEDEKKEEASKEEEKKEEAPKEEEKKDEAAKEEEKKEEAPKEEVPSEEKKEEAPSEVKNDEAPKEEEKKENEIHKEEAPKEEEKKEEAPKEEEKKDEVPKEEEKKEEAPKEEEKKDEVPKEEEKKEEVKVEAPKEEEKKEEAPKEEEKKEEAPKEEEKKEELPSDSAPKEEVPKEEAPKVDSNNIEEPKPEEAPKDS